MPLFLFKQCYQNLYISAIYISSVEWRLKHFFILVEWNMLGWPPRRLMKHKSTDEMSKYHSTNFTAKNTRMAPLRIERKFRAHWPHSQETVFWQALKIADCVSSCARIFDFLKFWFSFCLGVPCIYEIPEMMVTQIICRFLFSFGPEHILDFHGDWRIGILEFFLLRYARNIEAN